MQQPSLIIRSAIHKTRSMAIKFVFFSLSDYKHWKRISKCKDTHGDPQLTDFVQLLWVNLYKTIKILKYFLIFVEFMLYFTYEQEHKYLACTRINSSNRRRSKIYQLQASCVYRRHNPGVSFGDVMQKASSNVSTNAYGNDS